MSYTFRRGCLRLPRSNNEMQENCYWRSQCRLLIYTRCDVHDTSLWIRLSAYEVYGSCCLGTSLNFKGLPFKRIDIDIIHKQNKLLNKSVLIHLIFGSLWTFFHAVRFVSTISLWKNTIWKRCVVKLNLSHSQKEEKNRPYHPETAFFTHISFSSVLFC